MVWVRMTCFWVRTSKISSINWIIWLRLIEETTEAANMTTSNLRIIWNPLSKRVAVSMLHNLMIWAITCCTWRNVGLIVYTWLEATCAHPIKTKDNSSHLRNKNLNLMIENQIKVKSNNFVRLLTFFIKFWNK